MASSVHIGLAQLLGHVEPATSLAQADNETGDEGISVAAAAIITGVFTLLGGTLGAWITQRHTVRLAREQTAEARRDAQRKVLVRILAAGWKKADEYVWLLPIFKRLESESTQEWVEFSKGETVERLGKVNSEFADALTEASLLAGDAEVVAALDEVRRRERAFRDEVVGRAMHDDVGTAYQNLGEFRSALAKLEAVASPLVRVPVSLEKQGKQKRRGGQKPADS